MPEMGPKCLGTTFSVGAIRPSAPNSALSGDLNKPYLDNQAMPTKQPPIQPSQTSPERSPHPYHQQVIHPATKESVPLTVSGSGSISVKSDSAFN